MAAEDRSHQWLLDALYPDERDDQPTPPLAEESASDKASGERPLSRSAQQEIADYQAMLGEVRQGLVTFQPREEIRETIRSAARKEAEAIVSQMASEQSPRRAARARHATGELTEKSSFWSRARSQGAIQLIAVLAVCIGAGLLVRTMSHGDATLQSKFSPTSSVEQNAVAPAEPSFAMAPEEEVAEEAESARQDNLASKERSNNDFDDYNYDTRSQEASDKEDLKLALKQEAREPSTRTTRARRKARPTPSKKTSSSSSSWQKDAPSRSTGKSMNDSVTKERGDDVNGVEEDRYESKPSMDTQKPQPKGSIDSIFGGQEDVVQQEAMEKEQAPIVSGKRDALGNAMDSNFDNGPSQAPAEPAMAEGRASAPVEQPAKKAESKTRIAENSPTPSSTSVGGAPQLEAGGDAEAQSAGAANTTTLDDAERSYKRNDYEQTIEDADGYLARGIGSNKERARAMELKAEALTALGRGAEARGIYEAIRETYPDYYKKENIQLKKKRKAAPKRESSQSADELLESY